MQVKAHFDSSNKMMLRVRLFIGVHSHGALLTYNWRTYHAYARYIEFIRHYFFERTFRFFGLNECSYSLFFWIVMVQVATVRIRFIHSQIPSDCLKGHESFYKYLSISENRGGSKCWMGWAGAFLNFSLGLVPCTLNILATW